MSSKYFAKLERTGTLPYRQIQQKDKSQNGCYKKTKYAKISKKKEHFLPSDTYMHVYIDKEQWKKYFNEVL